MNNDEVIALLAENEEVGEAHVLLRYLELFLDIGEKNFYLPPIRIKIWKTSAVPQYPFRFTVSHHVHTPVQAGPYFPSRTNWESEELAIKQAIDTTTSFLKTAIREGHRPDESWLVENEGF